MEELFQTFSVVDSYGEDLTKYIDENLDITSSSYNEEL